MERISGFIIVCTAKFKFRVEKYTPAGVVISKSVKKWFAHTVTKKDWPLRLFCLVVCPLCYAMFNPLHIMNICRIA